jgi:oligopeptide transport system substrate-binding protein
MKNQMDHLFSKYLLQTHPQHKKLFTLLEELTQEDSTISYELCLENILFMLNHMDPSFVERRGVEFFKFFLRAWAQSPSFSKHPFGCKITFFNHLITFPFQYKKVVGFFILCHGVQNEAETLMTSVCNHHQNILLVQNSILFQLKPHTNQTILYFELQKIKGDFAPDEIQDLKESLQEIGKSITSKRIAPIPSLESSIKTLRWLMSELEEGDLPHVMIDLDLQTPQTLRFFVFICQITDLNTHLFTKLLNYPNIEIECQFRENIKQKIKEGIVLKIEVPNSASSLIEKRHQISYLIETFIGPFRDVNGGLLEQIEKNFQDFLAMLPDSPSQNLREFFDSITPEDERATCSPTILKQLYLTANQETDLTILEKEGWIGAVVKGDLEFEKTWKERLKERIHKIGFCKVPTSDTVMLGCFSHTEDPEALKILKTESHSLFQEWIQKYSPHQTLRLCTTLPFKSFDPRTGSEEEASYLHKMLFEGLMRIDPSGNVEPAIAEKVTVSDHGTLYRFVLRKTHWSNGMPLTAYDFLYSWKMVLTRKDLAPLNYLFDGIENAQDIKEGKKPLDSLGVKVIDDAILEVKLKGPCIPFLKICALTLFSPICQAVDEKHPSWSEADGGLYVCNGPFHLEKKEENGGVILKKNPLYWEAEKTRLTRVTIPVVSEEEGKQLFLNREVDALLYYFYRGLPLLDYGNLDIKYLKGAANLYFLSLNCLEPPFHNKKVRQAISLAMDQNKIAKDLPRDIHPSFSFYASVESYDNPIKEQNIQKAQELLIQAIVEDPKVRKTFSDRKISAAKISQPLAEVVCDHLNDVLGLKWTVLTNRKEGVQSYFKYKRQYQASILGWVDRIQDPSYFLGIFSSPSDFANFSLWTHPFMQSILEKLKVAKTHEEKNSLLDKARNLLIEELPMIPLVQTENTSVSHTYVKEIHANRLQQFDLRFSFKQESILKNGSNPDNGNPAHYQT